MLSKLAKYDNNSPVHNNTHTLEILQSTQETRPMLYSDTTHVQLHLIHGSSRYLALISWLLYVTAVYQRTQAQRFLHVFQLRFLSPSTYLAASRRWCHSRAVIKRSKNSVCSPLFLPKHCSVLCLCQFSPCNSALLLSVYGLSLSPSVHTRTCAVASPWLHIAVTACVSSQRRQSLP